MATIYTTGFEGGTFASAGMSLDGPGAAEVQIPIKHSGNFAAHFTSGVGTAGDMHLDSLDLSAFGLRCYVYVRLITNPAAETLNSNLLFLQDSSYNVNVGWRHTISAAGVIQLTCWGTPGNRLGTAAPVISQNTWHLLEMYGNTAGAYGFRFDGVIQEEGSQAAVFNAIRNYYYGSMNGGTGNLEVYYDDILITDQAAFPGPVGPDLSPTLVGVSTAMAVIATSGTNITPAFPTGYTAVADDIVVILAHHSANGPFNTPLAYAIASDGIETLDDNNTAAQRVTVFWHRLVAGDIAQPLVLTTNTVTTVRGAILFIIRGCRTTGNPFEVCKRLLNAAAVTISFPSVTTTLENAFLLALGAYEDDPSTRTTPTDWGLGTTFISALGNDMSLNYFTRVLASPATAAAFTTTVATGTFANSPSVGAVLAFVPPSEAAAAASLVIHAGVARRIGQLY